jgi:hypothetical protein
MIDHRATSRPVLTQRPAWRDRGSKAIAPRTSLAVDPGREGRIADHEARVQTELTAIAERAAASEGPEIAKMREKLKLYRQRCKAKKRLAEGVTS